jgi:hypothetical protein
MADVFWHERKPGWHSMPISAVQGLGEDDAILLMGDIRIPDWVRIPSDSPIGAGEERRVIAYGYHGCPKHEPETWRESGRVLHLQVEGGLFVAECVSCGFVVFSLGDA